MPIPEDYTNAFPPTPGATYEFPATTPRGLNFWAGFLNRLDPTQRLEFWHDFRDDPDGAPTNADSGQTFTQISKRTLAAPLVSSGAYVNNDNTASSDSYSELSCQLSGNVVFMEADFEFGAAGTTTGHTAVLVANAVKPDPLATALTDASAFVIMTDTYFQFNVISGGVTALSPIGGTATNITYATAMGSRLQHVEIWLDKLAQIAHCKLPDGQILSFGPHPQIGVAAIHASFEIYYNAAATDRRVLFRKLGAAPAPPLALGAMRAALTNAQYTRVNRVTGPYTLAASDAFNAVEYDSTVNGAITVPPSASVPIDQGMSFEVVPVNTGSVTLVPGTGVNLQTAGSLVSRGRYAPLWLRKRFSGTDDWLVTGDSA